MFEYYVLSVAELDGTRRCARRWFYVTLLLLLFITYDHFCVHPALQAKGTCVYLTTLEVAR